MTEELGFFFCFKTVFFGFLRAVGCCSSVVLGSIRIVIGLGSSHRKHKKKKRKRHRRHRHDTTESEEEDPTAWAYVAVRNVPQYAPVIYTTSAADTTNRRPWLAHGDVDARTEFTPKYLKYVEKHMVSQRKRSVNQIVPPNTVVECMCPDLLAHTCKYELPRKHRSRDPYSVSARVIHDWALMKSHKEVNLTQGEGVRKIKALKCTIDGKKGVRNVQAGVSTI